MSDTRVESIYFEKPGPKNTEAVLRIAKKRADELGIDTVLVATTSGATAARAVAVLTDHTVIAVTHSTGFREPNVQELAEAHRNTIEAAGGKVLTAQHALGGVNRAVRRKMNTYQLDEIIAYTLRIFGQGTKVCAEIAMMAADAGLVHAGTPCIAIGGSGQGADTALVLVPVNAQDFFDMRIVEVLAKPRLV